MRGEDFVWRCRRCSYNETPPRAWGRLFVHVVMPGKSRNTPTCVGKTRFYLVTTVEIQKHPHVRGEDGTKSHSLASWEETPPRAWGRRIYSKQVKNKNRNTPTCVGKTLHDGFKVGITQKHPHVRGEDSRMTSAMRRDSRNTPTCVGKTAWRSTMRMAERKHPHVRGEDAGRELKIHENEETPPRAWGRLNSIRHIRMLSRNTPTCVGKTLFSYVPRIRWRKHPHVRGEDSVATPIGWFPAETPPRAWGRRSSRRCAAAQGRNTPTCVGKTESPITYLSALWKHPHVRGEDELLKRHVNIVRGNTPTCVGKTRKCTPSITPQKKHPHVRGEDCRQWRRNGCGRGNTPTCVGKTPSLPLPVPSLRKHPHVRGEDTTATTTLQGIDRNTPTCVGKTFSLYIVLHRR